VGWAVSAYTEHPFFSAINKTSVTVVLAEGADAVKAADKAEYTVKIGEEIIPVTAVTYNSVNRNAVLTVIPFKKSIPIQ